MDSTYAEDSVILYESIALPHVSTVIHQRARARARARRVREAGPVGPGVSILLDRIAVKGSRLRRPPRATLGAFVLGAAALDGWSASPTTKYDRLREAVHRRD